MHIILASANSTTVQNVMQNDLKSFAKSIRLATGSGHFEVCVVALAFDESPVDWMVGVGEGKREKMWTNGRL